jgi:hypothetical protein
MGRDSILDDTDQSRQQNEQESEPSDSADEADGDGDRVRVTQRLPPDLAADVDAVKEKYSLPSRNATINFILNQGIDQLLDRGNQP